jgi:hypothetical protein
MGRRYSIKSGAAKLQSQVYQIVGNDNGEIEDILVFSLLLNILPLADISPCMIFLFSGVRTTMTKVV